MAGSSLGTAYVQIVPSAEGIKGSIQKVLDPEAENAGKQSGNKIAAFAKKALASAAVGKFLKDTIMEGARYEQAVGGIETLFGKSADKMKKYANEAYKSAGVSANEYMEQATSFASRLLRDTGGNTEKTAELVDLAIKDMSDNANKMGTSIEDIQNAYQGLAKGNATMLDNLKIGYGGTQTEALQLAKDMGVVDESVKSFNDMSFEDAILSIHKLQEELGITGTTALEGSTTISGSFAQMKAASANFMAQLVAGEDLSGAMDGLLDSALTFGKNLLTALGNVLLNLPDSIGHLAETIIAKLQESGDDPAIGNAAGEFIKNFVIGIVTNLPKLLAAALSLIGYLLSALGQAAGSLIASGAKAIADWASGMWSGFTTSASQVLNNIDAAITAKWESIKTSISNKASDAIQAVTSKFAEVKAAITTPFENARDKVKGIVDKIKGFFNFKVPTPHVPLPHFSISPAGWKIGDLLKGVKPSLSVKWFAEGGILDSPTLFGAGEAGPEAIMPLDKLKDYTAIDYDRLAGALVQALSSVNMTSTVEIDGKVVARTTAPFMESELNRIQKRADRKLGYI